ncbi:MAG: hypothetical protein QOC74_3162, partial [Pseudonocardiales bacterium]|nr:hypothetical protein [Pseudonocardiales bacterium]
EVSRPCAAGTPRAEDGAPGLPVPASVAQALLLSPAGLLLLLLLPVHLGGSELHPDWHASAR